MSSLADEISKLHQLLTAGILTNDEFADAKKALIATMMGGAASTAAAAPLPAIQQQQPSSPTFPSTLPSVDAAAAAAPQPLPSHLASAAAQSSSSAQHSHGGEQWVPDTSGFEVSHVGLNDTAFRHLHVILTNIANNPTDMKYRRLRRGNAKLADELFSSIGAERLLQSVGFTDLDTFNDATGVMESLFIFNLHSLVLSLDKQQDRVRSAIAAVQQLVIRDEKAAVEATTAAKLLRTVSLDIRRERLRSALAVMGQQQPPTAGGAADLLSTSTSLRESATAASQQQQPDTAYLMKRFIDPANTNPLHRLLAALFLKDGLTESSAIDNAKKLLTIEENVLKAVSAVADSEGQLPQTETVTDATVFETNAKYFRLALANAAASRVVLGQSGAIETLVELGGWTLRATAVGSSHPVVLWAPSSTTSPASPSSSPSASSPSTTDQKNLFASGVPHDLVLMDPNAPDQPLTLASFHRGADLTRVLRERAEATIGFLKALLKLLLEVQKRSQMREREEAMAAAKEEMRKGLVEERRRKEREHVRQRMASGVGEDGEQQCESGVRISTQDAIRYLMGKESKEDVLQRSADRANAAAAAKAATGTASSQLAHIAAAGKSRLLAGTAGKSQPQTSGSNGIDESSDNAEFATSASAAANATNVTHAISSILAANGDFDSDWSDD